MIIRGFLRQSREYITISAAGTVGGELQGSYSLVSALGG